MDEFNFATAAAVQTNILEEILKELRLQTIILQKILDAFNDPVTGVKITPGKPTPR